MSKARPDYDKSKDPYRHFYVNLSIEPHLDPGRLAKITEIAVGAGPKVDERNDEGGYMYYGAGSSRRVLVGWRMLMGRSRVRSLVELDVGGAAPQLRHIPARDCAHHGRPLALDVDRGLSRVDGRRVFRKEHVASRYASPAS